MPRSADQVRRHAPLLTSVLALALAGCQMNAPGQATMTLGAAGEAAAVSPPAFQTGGATGSDGFLTLALPDEAPLSKQIVKVTGGGSAGTLVKKLGEEAAPTIVNVIPNVTGFIIEGTKLDKATLKFYIGATEMTVAKRLAHQVVVTIPKTFKGTSGIITVRDGTTQIIRISADAKNVYVTGRVMVRFREGAPRATIEAALLASGITYYRYPGMNYIVAYHTPDQTFDQIKAKLVTHTVFDQVSRDTLFKGQGAIAPQDPRYAEQWALAKLVAPSGWQYATGSPDVIIAVLDTGIQLNHPDLAANIYKNIKEVAGNKIDDDGNGRIDDTSGWNSYDQTGATDDDNGHGTQVAGIIAARQDTVGITGLAPTSRVMPVKVSNGEGVATSSTIIDGINYAVRNRASVINMSLASNIDDPAVKEAIAFAETFNVTVVCAMGNDGNYIKQYPAAWSKDLKLLAVGATNSVDARPSWGTYGEWMTVCAPGEAILTTDRAGAYKSVAGTSYAAAHVSAIAALIKTLKPGWTPAQVREMIVTTAIDRGAPGFDQYYGNGRVTLDIAALGSLLQQVIGNFDVDASTVHELGLTQADAVSDKNSETYWSSARREADSPQWLRVDLGKPTRLTSIAALSAPFYAELFPADFTIEVSDDDVTWRSLVTVRDFKIEESTWKRWDIPATTTRYMRFNVTRSNINKDNGLYYAQVAEVAFNGEENGIIRNSSSSYYGYNYPSKHMIDKDPNTFWVSQNSITPKHEFAIADFGLARSFKTVKLLSPPRIISEAFPRSVSFSTSNDKVNWTFLKEFKGLEAQPATWYNFAVPAASGRYLRVDATETNKAQSHGSLYGGYQIEGYTAAVAEIEVE